MNDPMARGPAQQTTGSTAVPQYLVEPGWSPGNGPRTTPGRTPPDAASLHRDCAPDAADEDADLLQAAAELAQLVSTRVPAQQVLTRLVGLAARAVRGTDGSSACLGDPHRPSATTSSSSAAQHADGAQWRSEQGPGLDAYRLQLPIVVDDLGADARWPRFRTAVDPSAFTSALALPIAVDSVPNGTLNGRTAGVLTLYSGEPGTFSQPGTLDRALTFGTVAAATVGAAEVQEELRSTAEQLQVAMATRAPIEQAKGLVVGWLGCDTEEAFATLSRLSQDHNIKLRDLAGFLITDPSSAGARQLLAGAHRRAVDGSGVPGGSAALN